MTKLQLLFFFCCTIPYRQAEKAELDALLVKAHAELEDIRRQQLSLVQTAKSEANAALLREESVETNAVAAQEKLEVRWLLLCCFVWWNNAECICAVGISTWAIVHLTVAFVHLCV